MFNHNCFREFHTQITEPNTNSNVTKFQSQFADRSHVLMLYRRLTFVQHVSLLELLVQAVEHQLHVEVKYLHQHL